MVKIIGIPTEEQAISIYNDWKAERDLLNKQSKRHDNILLCVIAFVCVALIVGILFLVNWLMPAENHHVAYAMAFVGVPLICGMILMACWEGEWDCSSSSWPIQYLYYVNTKEMVVLDSRLENGSLELVLENQKHEVSRTSFGDFKKKIRTDVTEITLDLENEEILIPYKK